MKNVFWPTSGNGQIALICVLCVAAIASIIVSGNNLDARYRDDMRRHWDAGAPKPDRPTIMHTIPDGALSAAVFYAGFITLRFAFRPRPQAATE